MVQILGSAVSQSRSEGAVNGSAYPLRTRLYRNMTSLSNVDFLPHPGYHDKGCCTPQYLHHLNKYKVAICTSSRYGYALRKIIEATACGCRVITDLPVEDKLPLIDDNLIRVSSDATPRDIDKLVSKSVSEYDEDRQRNMAKRTVEYYNWRSMAFRS